MMLNHCFKVRSLILTAALLCALGLATQATARGGLYLINLNSKTITPLDTLGGIHNVAFDINDAGQVVGESGTAGGASHAFITGPDGVGVRNLGTLGGNYSSAQGINEAGQVVGWSKTAGGEFHAFITGPDGVGMRDLGPGAALDINNAGQVVGRSDTAAGVSHAFITGPDGVGMRDFGTLGGYLEGINDAGQVVGWSAMAGGGYAFITGPDGEGMVDLNSLAYLPQEAILTQAMAINNNGQVIAAGIIPEPQSYALMLAGLALVGFIARRKKAVNTVIN